MKSISNLEELTKKLEHKGLIQRSLIVICKETGKWWNITIQSELKLKQIQKTGVTCAACGKTINEENIGKLVSLTDVGKDMIRGSKWMTGEIASILIQNNVREEDIFASVSLKSEEIDVLILIFGEILVFELKDCNFELGDAYKFHAKVSRLVEKSEVTVTPIVITTEKVTSEAKKLLEDVQTDETHYTFIEGLKKVKKSIKKLTDDIALNKVKSTLRSVFNSLPASMIANEALFT